MVTSPHNRNCGGRCGERCGRVGKCVGGAVERGMWGVGGAEEV